MTTNPDVLVVSSIPGDAHVAALVAQGLASCHPSRAGEFTPRVAYMRCGYESDLIRPVLVEFAEAEAELRGRGVRIVNPVLSNARAQRKDLYYPLLQGASVPVPAFIPNPTVPEILAHVRSGFLRWPILFRSAEWSGGRGMRLVRREADIVGAIKEVLAETKRPGCAIGDRTIVVQYVDTKTAGGYERWRLYIAGEKVITHVRYLCDTWSGPGVNEGAPPLPAEWEEVARRTGVALGLSVFALDVVRGKGQKGLVVDVNPTYFYREPSSCSGDFALYVSQKRHFASVAQFLRSNHAVRDPHLGA